MSQKMVFRLWLYGFAFLFVTILSGYLFYKLLRAGLPDLITMQDYKPLMVSQVYDRNHKKIGEFFRERRTLVPMDKIPKHVVHAFLAAEDDEFYQHKGLNYTAILRSTLANLRAGRSVQGGSTITQQVAKTLMLSPEKTLLRKAREAMLAIQMEENLSKEEILYLYLNQIYFGQGAHGVENASQTYFRKPVTQLTLAEAAILAGLPKAPSKFSPIVNPSRAKERQKYVLSRMAEVGFVTKADADAAAVAPVKLYLRENYIEAAPFYLETVRQILVQALGEQKVLDEGISVYTSLDLAKQKAAQESVIKGLKELDKRQGFRGPLKNVDDDENDIAEVLINQKRKLLTEYTPERILLPDGNFEEIKEPAPVLASTKKEPPKPHTPLPFYMKQYQSVEGVVENVDDNLGLVFVRIPDAQGIIDFETMKWARKPDANKRFDLDEITLPSAALHRGDVILVNVAGERASMPNRIYQMVNKAKKENTPAPELPEFGNYVSLELDQEPIAESALISFDQQTQEILAMIGGYKFVPQRNEFNRAIQAARQTGSSFKVIVYASALDKGYTPSTPIVDAPVVYEEANEEEGQGKQEDAKIWKPSNHGKTFGGEIIFRNALVRSLNVPTVKIIEDISVPWAADYAQRLGVFNPLNMDFTLALGSSSVTLYEMTKVFAQFGRLGKRIRPIIIHKVTDKDGQVLLENVSLDIRFEKQIQELDQVYNTRREEYLAKQEAAAAAANPENPDQPKEEPKKEDSKKPDKNFFFQDAEQLIKPETAYVMTSLLKGVVEDPHGTGQRAKALGREVAGKTGSTSGYYDAWFIGYTAQIATGVWVGFDAERSLGKGEVGGRSALPIWVNYMKDAHEGLPLMTLQVPRGIVFANIDSETGKLASASTKHVLRQAFVEGTEPTSSSSKEEDEADFYKQDLEE